MFPLRDNIPARTTPFVNFLLIGLCAVVFFLQLQEKEEGPSMVELYGMIPARIMHPDRPVEIPDVKLMKTPSGVEQVMVFRLAAPSAVPPWLTPLTCIFLHGGWMHLLGNLWFLYIFGDNVEDRFGHFIYLFFYLASGIAASLVHLLSDPTSTVPTLGASGAIAGVMGAYFVFYPHARVLSVIPLGPILQTVVIPAPVFLGIWFMLQIAQSVFTGAESAGVAWWAHVGGFVVGAGGALLMRAIHMDRPPVVERLPNSERSFYRTPVRIRRDPPIR